LYKLGRTKEALTDVNKSLKLDEANSYAYKNRALIYLEMKDTGKACEDLNKALELGFTEQYGNEVKELKIKHCSP
jgi:tetratricopeptide (TPR) repeat protein